jgi:hypothetical protein
MNKQKARVCVYVYAYCSSAKEKSIQIEWIEQRWWKEKEDILVAWIGKKDRINIL